MAKWQINLMLVGVALVLVIVVGSAYLSYVRGSAEYDQLKKDTKEEIASLRDELKVAKQKIEDDKRTTQTPQQVVVKIPQYVPNLPEQPIVLQPNDPVTHQPLPNAPPLGVLFPTADVKPLFDHLADCKACSLSLTEMTAERDKEKKRADEAEKKLKGGGFWGKVKTCGVTITTNVGVGAAFGKQKGALVGAGVGTLGCVLQARQ